MNFQTLFSPARLAVAFLPIRALAATGILAGLHLTGTAAERATVAPGARITFQASAEGTPAPVFQWRKNGAAMVGATGQTFSIVSATASDAASYRVTASNVAGSADSPEIVIEVGFGGPAPNTPPAITLHPSAPATAIAGETVSLTVAASGSPNPTFQWLKNGVAMSGATQATLTISDLSSTDSAIYAAVATNVAGAAMSNSVTLTVTFPGTPNPPLPPPPPPPADVAPVITTQPAANLNVTAGNTVTFGVGASGTPTPTFQWQVNGIPIAGATNALLTLANVTTNDSGSYSAVAVNPAGSATSNPGVLVVTPATPPTPPPPPQPPTPSPAPTPPPTPPAPPGPPLPPTIATHPASTQTVVAGTTVHLAVAATGNPSPNLQWRKNGTSILGATNATLAFTSITTADAATYSVLATNASGTAVSQNAILIVNSRPVFSTQPAPQAVTLGARAIFTTVVSAIPGANLQWRKDGVALPGATRSALTIDFVGTSDLGVYSVVATNAWGASTSVGAALMLAAPPVITAQPANQTVAARSSVTFVAAAFGAPFPTYQWKKDGISISGATAAALNLESVEKPDEGFYSVEASNTMGWAVSQRAALIVSSTSGSGTSPTIGAPPDSAAASRIVNLSVRAKAGGGNSLIVGFVINGNDTKPMLVRGIGPTLSLFGLSDSLADPTLSLYSGANLSASNDDWRTSNNALQVIAASARLGAFSLPESAADSALLTALDAGAYTIQINGKGPSSGVALVEVYDAAPDSPASLVNLSVRTHVGSGTDAPNLGFVIAGGGPKRVVIRAVGPTLAAFGVSDVISDPKLELYRGNVRIDQNDNWGGSAALTSTFERIGAFGLQEPGSRDAALLVSLEPGAYTVVVSGVGGSAGVALVEVYEAP